MIFETHAHYDDARYDEDREQTFRMIRSAGVDRVVNVSASYEGIFDILDMVRELRKRKSGKYVFGQAISSIKAANLEGIGKDNLAEQDALSRQKDDLPGEIQQDQNKAGLSEGSEAQIPLFYATVGVHPCEVGVLSDSHIEKMKECCKEEFVVAIGEIGLDYYWIGKDERTPDKDVQKKWFISQLELAKDAGLPVVIHSRDASQDTFDIIKDYHAGTTGGIIHCYSGSVEMAKEYVKLGYYIGVGGVVTFKNSKVLKAVVREIPLSNIVLETDCPYLAPTPHRGERNCSAYISFVADTIADLKGMTREEVEEICYKNALKVFAIND